MTDKLSIVDIKAKDGLGVVYQIEVQLSTPSHLANRMLYNWCDLYKTQISGGDSFSDLKPVISIWLLSGRYYKDEIVHHHFEMFDQRNKVLMTDHCSVHVFELEKWRKPETLQLEDIWFHPARKKRVLAAFSGMEVKPGMAEPGQPFMDENNVNVCRERIARFVSHL